jgi:hypothetical protein
VDSRISRSLADFGVPREAVRDLSADATPGHIPYLDLMRTGRPGAPRPDAVVEFQGSPVAYAVDATKGGPPPGAIALLHRTLAYRADAPYLLVVEPGRLVVRALSLDQALAAVQTELGIRRDDPGATSTFLRLSMEPEGLPAGSPEQEVHQLLFGLLTKSISRLSEHGVSQDDAISLTGRALFLRFILDRGILKSDEIGSVCSGAASEGDLFRHATATRETCRWLDRNFNGDFLPVELLRDNTLSKMPAGTFDALTDIMHRSEGGQTVFDWAAVDFAHVPAGLLSQVYEHQAALSDPTHRHSASVYYTPRRIAEYMVREAFAAICRERGEPKAKDARVLDPASGGGVFLVAAFRELVRLHWSVSEARPDTKKLRSILYKQIAGYEVTEAALRLTALSLYLTTLELDPNPRPIEKLRFDPLRATVLRDVSDGHSPRTIGTIGADIKDGEGFDLVIGNPPWTGASSDVSARMTEAIRPIVAARLGAPRAAAFSLPDGVPDLAFLWKAADLARSDGWIAFALHGRFLFKDTKPGQQARAQILEAFAVTGILNGADLRMTDVWPNIQAPFCLLFCRNRRPEPESAFYFASAYEEESLNAQGRLRLDSSAAVPVAVETARNNPLLFKVLFRGGPLDLALLRRIEALGLPTLKNYWTGLGLATSQGFQVGTSEREDAKPLRGMPLLRSEQQGRFFLDTRTLPAFDHERVHRLRDRNAYRGPLLLVRKSPPAGDDVPSVTVSKGDVAYTESFYGYSARGHGEAEALATYVGLILNSDLFLWHLLLTSGEFGVERDSIQKRDVDRFPLVPLDRLSQDQRAQVTDLAAAFHKDAKTARPRVGKFVQDLYGIDSSEWRVVLDTLEVGLPYRESKQRAQERPSEAEVDRFAKAVRNIVSKFTPESHVTVRALPFVEHRPWRILDLRTCASNGSSAISEREAMRALLDAADDLAASQVLARLDATHRILVGILAEYRYWTPTRARQLGVHLVQEYLDGVPTAEEA